MNHNPPTEQPARPAGAGFASDYGYFTPDGLEYVVTRPDTPRPWANVITNGDYGCIVSQAGGGFSWRGNSQLRMLNRWNQDLIRDVEGRFLYIEDTDTAALWSADWQPTQPDADAFRVRHGLGYTVTEIDVCGVRCEKTVFVPLTAPGEIWRVRLTDLTGNPRSLALTTYLEWQLGAVSEWHREFHKTFMETEWVAGENALFAWKKGDVENADVPFSAFHAVLSHPAAGYDADKESFLGRYGSPARPRGVTEGRLAGRTGRWNDSIAALRVDVPLAAHGTAEVVFVVGAGTRAELSAMAERFRRPGAVDAALNEVTSMWRGWLDATRVDTPDAALNIMSNAWLKYQAIAGRLWARTGYYQNSGAFGFRDQLQDAHIWLPVEPERTRQQILLHASRQFPDGTVQHWWHPGTSIAAVTECTDDLLWLPYLTMNYIDETDDAGIWDAAVPFLPAPDGRVEEGALYEHSVRAIEKALTRFSPRGLPLIGEMDWNDGLSHLGRAWKGESVWLGHFLVGLLRRFADHADERADAPRADRYRARADALANAINAHCWDGAWYWRATKDNGETLGSHTCTENQIDLIAQAWAIINGVAPPDRARQCMASARQRLFREYGPLLLTPAYSKTDPDIGYITRYAPGVRENGGVYSHAATWGIEALAMLGEGAAAHAAYAAMCPPRRGEDPDLYFAEPYVLPGNIDGPDSPTFGRGGWTWYTGSAAWMQKIALDWICGVRATRAGLRIDPCVPESWTAFRVRRLFRGATYEIAVENPHGLQKGTVRLEVDGRPIEGDTLPPAPPRATVHVTARMEPPSS